MLRLLDPRTGRAEELPRDVLRLHVHGTGLRIHVVADLLRRVAERNGRRVVSIRPAGPDLELDRPLEDFNVRPPTHEYRPAGEAAHDTADTALHLAETAGPGRCVTVPPAAGDWPAAVRRADVDPLVVRLAMLAVHYPDPLTVDDKAVHAAAERLAWWRSMVAVWARSPGRPMDKAYAREAGGLLAHDLDTPGAIGVLDRLATDDEVAPGARLETFIHLDLLMGLDVVRDIGR